ncbi:MAG: hypothetical protein IJ125_09585 [Atopobiaceae bacterium]|nr:hypothetical protein [Atopobiaceae bacterium]
MDKKSIINDTLVAFLSQGVGMFLSVIQSLLIPKILGVAEFGYWQLFIFYSSYVGLFHLGLNDGVYLIAGGQTRDKIDKASIKSQFIAGAAYQLIFAAVIVFIALSGGFGAEREFVIACTGLFLVIKNTATYLMYVLQAMNETKKSSYSVILERLIFLVPLAVLLVTRTTDFRPYVLSYLFSSLAQLLYCLWNVRDFISAGRFSPQEALGSCATSIRVGIKLMIANLASQLILGIARLIIDFEWGIETFSQLSLALSLVTFFLAFVISASMVLFPALRQGTDAEVRSFFGSARTLMGLVFPLVYLLYYPMVWLLGMWLPAYAESFIFFAYLIPICVFDSKMNIASTTFFKVKRMEKTLLIINVATALISTLLVIIGATLLHSIHFLIGSVVVAIIGRSLVSEHIVERELSLEPDLISWGEIVLTVLFMVSVVFLPAPLGFLTSTVAYGAFLWVNRKRLQGFIKGMRS